MSVGELSNGESGWSVAMVAAVIASAGATWLVRRIANNRKLLDRPNQRSAHVCPTPRIGGVAIMATFLPLAAVLVGFRSPGALVVLAATAAIAVLGVVDDLRSLSARVRFGCQVAAAVAVVAFSNVWAADIWLSLPGRVPYSVAAVVSVLWIVWMTNLYNFMDGIDGLAGGQALIGGFAVAAVALLGGATHIAVLASLLGASTLGFLRFNFPPASIFMGDVGSTAIGFFVACIPFLPDAGPVSIEVIGLAFSMFILDATITLFRRMVRGERFFEAHRSHYYQRLLKVGVPHRPVTLTAYAAMIVSGLVAVAYSCASRDVRFALLLIPVGVFAVLVRAITWIERRREADRAASAVDRVAA